jgi:hypothetical protein
MLWYDIEGYCTEIPKYTVLRCRRIITFEVTVPITFEVTDMRDGNYGKDFYHKFDLLLFLR